MIGLVYAANALGQGQASATETQVDAGFGMPIAGRDIGGGIHAPAWQSETQTYAQPFQQANNTWAYPVDANSQQYLTAPQVSALTTITPVVASLGQASMTMVL